jgi:hypothetical protein
MKRKRKLKIDLILTVVCGLDGSDAIAYLAVAVTTALDLGH